MYDPSVGRFIGADALADHPNQLRLTPYNYTWNNPVNLTDPDGNIPNPIIGAIIGAGVDYAFQVGANLAKGKDLKASLTEVDTRSIFISAGTGALTSGVSAFTSRATSKLVQEGGEFVLETAVDATESVLKQINTGALEGKSISESVSFEQTASDVISNKVGGTITKKFESVIDTKVTERNLDRAERIASGSNPRQSRVENVNTLRTQLRNQNTVNQVVEQGTSGAAGNALQETSNGVRSINPSSRSNSTNSGNLLLSGPSHIAVQDNTSTRIIY